MANKTLSFEILRPVIIDAIKTETHIKGVIDKALDEKAAQAAYNETIGDEEHHNRKIDRAITAYAETLVAQISDVLSGNSNISTDYSDPTKIVISVLPESISEISATRFSAEAVIVRSIFRR